jgi:hypothetical protein
MVRVGTFRSFMGTITFNADQITVIDYLRQQTAYPDFAREHPEWSGEQFLVTTYLWDDHGRQYRLADKMFAKSLPVQFLKPDEILDRAKNRLDLSEIPWRSLVPSGFGVMKYVSTDLDFDGKPETIAALLSDKQHYPEEPFVDAPIELLLLRQYGPGSCEGVTRINVRDDATFCDLAVGTVGQRRIPVVYLTSFSPGVSGATFILDVYISAP